MKKEKKGTGLVPRLRFPEFGDEPAWECPPLKKLADRVTQRSAPGAKLRPLTNSAEHGVVDQREYFDKDIATNTDNYYVVERGDFVYNPRVSSAAPVGPISKNQIGTGVMSPLYTVFRFRSDTNDFFAHYFKSSHWHEYLRRVANSGARHDRMAITNDDLMGMPIPTPSLPEQQKIADCLSSLDDLITAERRKLEALRQHKQGLMQQLFPRPGERVPRLRFAEFVDDPEWRVVEFEQLYEFKPTNIYSRDQLNYDAGTVRNIHYGDIHTRFSTQFRVGDELVPYVNSIALPDKINPEALCKEGDMVFADASEDLADVGKSIEIVDLNDEPVLSGSHTILARRRDSTLVLGFGAYLFKSRYVRAQIEREAQGTKVMSISPTRLVRVKVLFPSEHEEQRRITDCLATLDAQIAYRTERLDALRLHKQALLQQLFPTLKGTEQ